MIERYTFEIYETTDGARLRFVSPNGEIVIPVEAYASKSNVRRAIRTIREHAPRAHVRVVKPDEPDQPT